MKPIGVTYKRKKGWQLIHQCCACGETSTNKIAIDTQDADDIRMLSAVQQSDMKKPDKP